MIDFITLARESGYLCFDVEFETNTDVFSEGFAIHGCGFASVKDGEIIRDYITDKAVIKEIIDTTFADPNIQIIAHNAKFDMNCLKRVDMYPCDPQIRCTMVALNLLDDNLNHSELGLKPTVLREYNYQMESYKEAASHGLDSQEFYNYACDDVHYELQLFLDLEPMLKPFWDLYTKILMPSLIAFSDMECFGMYWDIETAEDFYAKLFKARNSLLAKIQKKIGRVNIDSNQQLAKRLFIELGYSTKYTEKGKSGHFCVDASVLDQMAKQYPICNWIRAYRSCQKLINTYLEPAYKQYNDNEDNRIHSSYWLVSQTGRTRCSNLNNQNMPARVGADLGELAHIFAEVKLRRAVATPPGKKLVVCDLSQVELRLAGHIMDEPDFINAYCDWRCYVCDSKGTSSKMLHNCPKCDIFENEKDFKEGEGFWQGRDLHTEVLTHVPEKIRAKLTRADGKTLNFAILYKASAWRLHCEHPAISPEEWQAAIDSIMRSRPKARSYHEKSEYLLKSKGSRPTIFGRRRRIPKETYAPNGIFDRKKFKHALNQFINAPIQGAGADLAHVIIVKLRKHFIDKGWWGTRVKMINFVHDEFVFEADEDICKEVLQDVIDVSESAVELVVPIRMDGGIFDNYGDAK